MVEGQGLYDHPIMPGAVVGALQGQCHKQASREADDQQQQFHAQPGVGRAPENLRHRRILMSMSLQLWLRGCAGVCYFCYRRGLSMASRAPARHSPALAWQFAQSPRPQPDRPVDTLLQVKLSIGVFHRKAWPYQKAHRCGCMPKYLSDICA